MGTPRTLDLRALVERRDSAKPWGGEKIPWDTPDFSERMLAEHLSQQHDRASRRGDIILRHVGWLNEQVLCGRPARVLDLCCGPGLYTAALARLGHECIGIDFSPASIRYARQRASEEGLRCLYVQADVRIADYGTGYDLTALIFGEFNAFVPADADTILSKACAALADGGKLVIEAHTYDAIRRSGQQPPVWYSSPDGLFSPRPHLVLTESYWDKDASVATRRYFVVDVATGSLTRHAEAAHAYTDEQYRSLLANSGFEVQDRLDSLPGTAEIERRDFVTWIATPLSDQPRGD